MSRPSLRPGFFTLLYRNLRSSLSQLRRKKKCVGSDEFGNTYFEIEADPAKRVKGSRWVEAENNDGMTAPNIPSEWNVWLNNQSKNPPTKEMIARNQAILKRTLRRAQELEEKDKREKGEENTGSWTKTSLKDYSDTEGQFPNFKDYEITPGIPRNKKKNT